MQIKSTDNEIQGLVQKVFDTHEYLQSTTQKIINQNLTIRNWLIGFYIVEFEQAGNNRALYGAELLKTLAADLKQKGIKGLSRRSLNDCKNFYIAYPEIWQTMSAKSELKQLIGKNELIWGTVSAKLDDYTIPSDLLLSQLGYSHFVELMKITDKTERLFYEVETIKNNWSTRELIRAINTSLYFRTAYSTDKDAIVGKIKNLVPANWKDVVRDPYILEFLDIEEKKEYNESDIEQSILDHIQIFLCELGTGICFEARQKRITFGNKHLRIDMVLYHRIMKFTILLDFKFGAFDHADAGQMNTYLNYWKDNEMTPGDNDPIGIILCANKDEALVEYATGGMDNNLFVSKYLLNLPDKKKLEEFIRKELL